MTGDGFFWSSILVPDRPLSPCAMYHVPRAMCHLRLGNPRQSIVAPSRQPSIWNKNLRPRECSVEWVVYMYNRCRKVSNPFAPLFFLFPCRTTPQRGSSNLFVLFFFFLGLPTLDRKCETESLSL